jgi:hypothetical protein
MKTANWKINITSFANKNNLSDARIDRIMNCFNENEYQDFKKHTTEDNKKYDIYPLAQWQFRKADDIEKLWHKSIKYIQSINSLDDVVNVEVDFEIDFPHDFDKNDVWSWVEDLNRINKIYLMVQIKDLVKNIELDENENKFIDDLIKNQKMTVEMCD